METGNVSSVGDFVKPKLPDTDYTAEFTKIDVMSPKPEDNNIQRNQGITSKLETSFLYSIYITTYHFHPDKRNVCITCFQK